MVAPSGQRLFGAHTRTVNGRTFEMTGKTALEGRADAEAPLIVQLYFEGNSLTRIGEILNRPVEYVSRVFHSDYGLAERGKLMRTRAQIRDEVRDRATYAAQGALDEIIRLSRNGESEAVRRLASKDLLELAEVAPQQTKGGVTVTISDEALGRMCAVLEEIRSPLKETFPQETPPAIVGPQIAEGPEASA